MGWLREHKLLLVVYGAALALAAFELNDPSLRPGRPDDPEIYLEPDVNIADVSAELYPDRALSLYYRAYQASLCSDPGVAASAVCRQRGPVAPGEVRQLLERSLRTGNRSVELAEYNYVMVLLQENAPKSEVDAAVRRWRLDYPSSERSDPRLVYRDMLGRRGSAKTRTAGAGPRPGPPGDVAPAGEGAAEPAREEAAAR